MFIVVDRLNAARVGANGHGEVFISQDIVFSDRLGSLGGFATGRLELDAGKNPWPARPTIACPVSSVLAASRRMVA